MRSLPQARRPSNCSGPPVARNRNMRPIPSKGHFRFSLRDNMLWTTPVYRFRILAEDDPESEDLKEIVIDVTGSAPSFLGPSEGLKQVLEEIFSSESFKIETIVEFGAGKLERR